MTECRVVGPLGSADTYAFLDNGSESSLMDPDFVKMLGLTAEQSKLSVSTVVQTGEKNSEVFSFELSGLEEKGRLEVKRSWSVSNPSQVTGIALAANPPASWKHLQDLKIPALKGAKVYVLIGMYVPAAHWAPEHG
ncbi:hypothetical protein D915_009063 [Fasciola hepatica]|uniref:Peptidase aspartic putative domain-containing protein n=1 Tax=Fasciola hepatica TaxID=6192 RepID=A0A4E0QX46_FASHE|nr:hypothetical protein D915_009063 [Fasciola hepatica]